MAKIEITTGPSASGKTMYAVRKAVESNAAPEGEKWRRAGSLNQVRMLTMNGYNVVLDLEELTGHDVELVRFFREGEEPGPSVLDTLLRLHDEEDANFRSFLQHVDGESDVEGHEFEHERFMIELAGKFATAVREGKI